MNRPIKYIILLIIGIACSEYLYSQAMTENFDDYKIQSYGDTIVVHNNLGKWWFGPIIGINCNLFYNQLTTLKFPDQSENPFNKLLKFSDGFGLGWFTGAFIEYSPPNQILSYGAKIYLPDVRYSKSLYVQKIDSFQYKYQYDGKYNYIDFTPYLKYYTPINGVYATFGLNLETSYSNQGRLTHLRNDTSDIKHKFKITHEKMRIRYGLEVGAGWEFTVNDINDKIRVRFNPYITASAGSKILADLNSNWNFVVIKLGLGIKFGFNQVSYDTLKYKENSYQLPEIYALATTPQQISFEITKNTKALPAYELAVVSEEPTIEVALEGSISRIKSGTSTNQGSENQPQKPVVAIPPLESKPVELPKLNFGDKNPKVLGYRNDKDVALTNEMKNYLDNIINYIESKSIKEIFIFGYTAELGDRQKNLAVSKRRADAAYKYLIDAGVNKKANVYRDGKGAINPIAGSDTPSERNKNNRVEIILK